MAESRYTGRIRTPGDRLNAWIGLRGLLLSTPMTLRDLTRLTFASCSNAPRNPYWYRVSHGALPYNTDPIATVDRFYPGSASWFFHPLWDGMRLVEVSARSPVDRDLREIATEAFFALATRRFGRTRFEEAESAVEFLFLDVLCQDPPRLRRIASRYGFRPAFRQALARCFTAEPLLGWAPGVLRRVEMCLSARLAYAQDRSTILRRQIAKL